MKTKPLEIIREFSFWYICMCTSVITYDQRTTPSVNNNKVKRERKRNKLKKKMNRYEYTLALAFAYGVKV